MEQFKNLKFAMGIIYGVYNEDPQNDIRDVFNQKGPNGEQAYSGMVIWVVNFFSGGYKIRRFLPKNQ